VSGGGLAWYVKESIYPLDCACFRYLLTDSRIGCDAVMISHNHYDHLDLPTIAALFKKFPHAKYFVPLGNRSWLRSLGIAHTSIIELDWWDVREWSVEDLGYNLRDKLEDNDREETRLRFTCVPAQHNSGRGGFDQGTTLWSGWVVEQFVVSPSKDATPSLPSQPQKMYRKGAVYHAGDTGYRPSSRSPTVCPIFKEIGAKFGGFDMSFIPIWRGGSLGFISYLGFRLGHDEIPSALHASPADALDIHGDVKSRHSIGVHFGTWVGSVNESLESVVEFEFAREKRGVDMLEDRDAGEKMGEKGRAGILDIGGSFAVEMQAEEVQS
jgi:N-acyl-phosphatidylethanolamine-hydrolysing phospholipase D